MKTEETKLGGIKLYNKTCKNCGETFESEKRFERFCVACKVRQCDQCNASFEMRSATQKFCSNKCKIESLKVTKTCLYCGNDFRTRHDSNYCSRSCTVKGTRGARLEKLECTNCGDEFERKAHEVKGHKVGNFCSRSCWDSYNSSTKGEKHHKYTSVEVSCSKCGKTFVRQPHAMKSSKHYCSQECYIDEMYNDTLSDEEREKNRDYPAYSKWRKDVFLRDDFTCKCCGIRGGKLVAHHILNFHSHPTLRVDVNNGVTLCENCHRSFHKEYGTKANNAEQLEEFITKLTP